MARPTCRGYVARGRGEVHPAFRTSYLVLIRELLLSLVELLLLPFQSFQPSKFLLIPELLLLLQLQPGLLLAHPFEFVPWGGWIFRGEIAHGVPFSWGALVAVKRVVSWVAAGATRCSVGMVRAVLDGMITRSAEGALVVVAHCRGACCDPCALGTCWVMARGG